MPLTKEIGALENSISIEKSGIMNKIFTKNNLVLRILTGLVLGLFVTVVTILGGMYFNGFLILSLVLSLFEFFNIIKGSEVASISSKYAWSLIGAVYIFLAIFSLHYVGKYGLFPYNIFMLFFTAWIFDSASYFVGKAIGGPKLLPGISPQKTWAGFLGGVFFVALSPFMLTACAPQMPVYLASHTLLISLIAIILGLIGQIGDFLESYFKRQFGVKDSGSVLPGHGGILDRMDSLFLTAPFLSLVIHLGGF
jgi:phosphatidate cytidylyltransferase